MSDKHKLDLDTQVAQARKVKALTAENSRKRAAINELVDALRKYGEHEARCVVWDAVVLRSCTCGLDAILAKYTNEKGA